MVYIFQFIINQPIIKARYKSHTSLIGIKGIDRQNVDLSFLNNKVMETSILVAQIMCVVYLSVGIGLIFSRNYYQDAFIELIENKGYVFLGGWMALVAGVVLVHYHNLWVNDWRVIVTIVGWIALIKGIWLFAFPGTIRLYKPLFLKPAILNLLIPLIIILGGVFGYFGFLN